MKIMAPAKGIAMGEAKGKYNDPNQTGIMPRCCGNGLSLAIE